MPDGDDVLTYELALPTVRSVEATFSARAPVAGKVFTVSSVRLTLTNNAEVRPQSLTCRATLAGKVLKPVARCSWRLPANAKGKRLLIQMTLAYDGQSGSLRSPFAFTVR